MKDHDPDDVDEVPVQPAISSVSDCDSAAFVPRKMLDPETSSQITPIVTCAPWKPVSTKNVEPNRFVWSFRPS